MLNYETLLSFIFYFLILLGGQICCFAKKILLIVVLELPYIATYFDKSKD